MKERVCSEIDFRREIDVFGETINEICRLIHRSLNNDRRIREDGTQSDSPTRAGGVSRMSPSAVTPKVRFASLVEEFRSNRKIILPSVEGDSKKRFGSSGLKVNNKIFAMLAKDRLVVQLPQQRVKLLASSGDGDR